MARPLRRPVVDGWYHVFGHGNERRAIFGGQREREQFLRLLAVLAERFRVRVHSRVRRIYGCAGVVGDGMPEGAEQ